MIQRLYYFYAILCHYFGCRITQRLVSTNADHLRHRYDNVVHCDPCSVMKCDSKDRRNGDDAFHVV